MTPVRSATPKLSMALSVSWFRVAGTSALVLIGTVFFLLGCGKSSGGSSCCANDAPPVVTGTVIFESSIGDYESACCAALVGSTGMAAFSFSVDERTHVTGIGANFKDIFASSGKIFGAIIELAPSGLPSDESMTLDTVLASTAFAPGIFDGDAVVPLELTLEPGTYAVVLGSGMFGATGTRYLTHPDANQVSASFGTQFRTSVNQPWRSSSHPIRSRVLVVGEPAP